MHSKYKQKKTVQVRTVDSPWMVTAFWSWKTALILRLTPHLFLLGFLLKEMNTGESALCSFSNQASF